MLMILQTSMAYVADGEVKPDAMPRVVRVGPNCELVFEVPNADHPTKVAGLEVSVKNKVAGPAGRAGAVARGGGQGMGKKYRQITNGI